MTPLPPPHYRPARRREGGFTMIEIAFALAVIAFALVAIIGILPAGLNVQKDNREGTIINSDAAFFLQTLRNGAVVSNGYVLGHGLDFLSNYVESIQINSTNGATTSSFTYPNNNVSFGFNTVQSGGEKILGLLTTPTYYVDDITRVYSQFGPRPTNYVRATVRALNGSALTQEGANSVVAFRYIMDVQITPFTSFPFEVMSNNPAWTNRWNEAGAMSHNLYEARLTFHWPVLPSGAPGPNHLVFCSTISGCLTNYALPNETYFYFQPQTFSATNTFQ